MQRPSDTLLLEEAYRATQLTQHLPDMTVQRVQLVIENASPTELEILDEGLRSMLGGAGNVLRGGKEAIQRTGSAVKGAAERAGGAIKTGVERAGDAAKAGGAAAGAAAGQVAKNIGQQYQTGKSASEASQRKEQLINHLGQLEDLFNAHKEASPDSRLKNMRFDAITFKQLKHALGATVGVSKRAAQKARSQGFFKGAGRAAGVAGQKAFDKAKEERENPRLAGGGSGDQSRYAGPAPA